MRVARAGTALPVELWMDTANLRPGEQWHDAIAEALGASLGFTRYEFFAK